MYLIATFYKFIEIEDTTSLQEKFKAFCSDRAIKGTIIIASEGINATICGAESDIQTFYKFAQSIKEVQLDDLFFQESWSEFMPFQKLKVKIKPEIVTLKVKNLDMQNSGEYIKPDDWDQFISRSDVKLIDTRNYYEIAMGSFENAINPNTNNFTDFIKWIEENQLKFDFETPIAMFCTGGVRCEKSTAYMKKLGYKNVYHLQGGIINYLKCKNNQSNTWHGSCFIFDDRVMIDNKLQVCKSDCIKNS